MTRATRDKETYFIQRSAISRVEHESISKFIEKTESRFEANWATYEQQLQKYEGDIRKHISIEHQLQLFAEDLKRSVAQLEKEKEQVE